MFNKKSLTRRQRFPRPPDDSNECACKHYAKLKLQLPASSSSHHFHHEHRTTHQEEGTCDAAHLDEDQSQAHNVNHYCENQTDVQSIQLNINIQPRMISILGELGNFLSQVSSLWLTLNYLLETLPQLPPPQSKK